MDNLILKTTINKNDGFVNINTENGLNSFDGDYTCIVKNINEIFEKKINFVTDSCCGDGVPQVCI